MSDLKKIKDEFLLKLKGKLDISEINQIKSETFKALIGINLSKSLADDCSNLCCNLAKTKTPFLKDLITLLEKYKIITDNYNL